MSIKIALARFKYDLGNTVVALFQAPVEELEKLRSSKDCIGIERMVARAILESDFKFIELFLGRTLGKAPDEINHPDSGQVAFDNIFGKREIDCEF